MTPSLSQPDPVPYNIIGANDVPKTYSDTNPDYSVSNGILVDRTGHPVAFAYSCNVGLARGIDFVVNSDGVGEKHYHLSNAPANTTIQELTGTDSGGNVFPAGRVTLGSANCAIGVSSNSAKAVLVNAGQPVSGQGMCDFFA